MTLADQILQRWGQYGDWQAAGQNQAADLARLLEANGITDLSKLSFAKREYELPGYVEERESGPGTIDPQKRTTFDVRYGDQDLGFLGDINRDGSLGKLAATDGFGRLTDRGDSGPILGWSARGGGNTSFRLVENPQTGEVVVAPTWGSSSQETFDDIRGIGSILALAAGAYYAPTSAAASGALQGQGLATAGAMLGEGDVNSINKAGLAGAATGAIGGGIKDIGSTYGWDQATAKAVGGGVNAAVRGGSGEDILKGAVGGYLSGGGQSLVNSFMPGQSVQLENGFFDQGGAGNAGGNMDFSNYFDGSLYDFGGSGIDFGSGWSNNVFGDSFGNSPVDFGQAFDPSLYDFGQVFDGTIPNVGGGLPSNGGGIDWAKLGGQAWNWLTSGTGANGKGVPPWAMLLGAGLGAMDGKDKTATSSRDPWAPMQPYLLGLAEDGRGLYNQLKAQPFSQAQQTAYGNVGGLLDVLNQNAGGLLQGMQANATGRNQFVRGQPRQLIGSAPIDGMAFTPGLLGSFGTRRG